VLEIDDGNKVFVEVQSYALTSFSMQHTVTYATDHIETGKIYTFRFKS
jgi:hypothetical protein